MSTSLVLDVALLLGAALIILFISRRVSLALARKRLRSSEQEEWTSDAWLAARAISTNGTARWTHVVSLIGQAIQESLRQLRRVERCPPEVLQQLEHTAWQARMLVTRPRPMQTKPASPIALLQEAAEETELLRNGKVGASWSLSTRQPVQVDPERARAAFRQLLSAAAVSCGEGGKLGIRILPAAETGYTVRVEIEIGRPGREIAPLAFLVARHLFENQGAHVEIDGSISRVLLRNAMPAPLEENGTSQ